MIADEVICGFGRLGEWFGSEYFDIEADLMPIAKGLSSGYLPIGGLMVGDRVTETVINKGSDFNHGFTYSGHPAACAVALENIRILKDEKIIENNDIIKDAYILLIDDIYVKGSTVNICSSILLENGAKRVIQLCAGKNYYQ